MLTRTLHKLTEAAGPAAVSRSSGSSNSSSWSLSGAAQLLGGAHRQLLGSGGSLMVIIIITTAASLTQCQPQQQQQQQQQQLIVPLVAPIAPLIARGLVQLSGGRSANNNHNNNQHLSHNNQPQQQQQQQQQALTSAPQAATKAPHRAAHHPQSGLHLAAAAKRPQLPSSSSPGLVEDLTDSSIRTRLGVFNGTNNGNQQLQQELMQSPNPFDSIRPSPDFEELIDRLLGPISAAAQKSATFGQLPALDRQLDKVAADPNNKTTMRFFRNSKTFASIVYTNEPLQQQHSKRKLINCHLVDLEKHSADVEVFESKYQIKTIDVEFREMMQLIDACTEIARLHSSRAQATPGSSAHQDRQLFAHPIAKMAPSAPTEASGGALAFRPRAMAVSAATPSIVSYIKRTLKGRPPELVNKALSQVGETGKRLVLGEVTPLPGLVEARGGTLKEALQEITSYDTTDLLALWRGILPGTNWCGMGDRATSYNDLGFEADIDICCRAHDFCPIRLSAFSSGYGLFNWSFYTRSHCLCDQNFLDCLQRAQSPLSAVVMKFYFTIMKTTCLHDNETRDPSPYSAATAANRNKLTPSLVSWWSPLAAGNKDSSKGQQQVDSHRSAAPQKQPAGNSQSRQQHQQQQQPEQANSNSNNNWEQEQKLMLEQIRAKMPIPALKLSQAFYSSFDPKPATKIASTRRLAAGYK